jgi:benzoyl-CoA reductase subunit C
MANATQEKKLKSLVEGNSEANRSKWALESKKQGKKVLGVMCSYVPNEVIHAAGMLPWRVTGSWSTDIHPVAAIHHPISTQPFYTHILDARLKGQLDFLDGTVFTNRDDDMRRIYDIWVYTRNTNLTHIMFLPYHRRESAQKNFQGEISKLISVLENFGGKKITDDSLLSAIKEYNRMRDLLTNLYELRKKDKPAVSGAEVLGITTAAQVMPVDVFNKELEGLLPYLAGRVAPIMNSETKRVRLMVSSDALDNPVFINVIEEAGAIVAMDDMDTGSRWFWQDVDIKEASKEPVKALASRYLGRPACPRMNNWVEQIEQSIAWAKEFKVDGIIDFTEINNYPRQFRVPLFRKAIEKAGIPVLSITRDYVPTGIGQLKTRFEAFIEMLTV